MPDSLTTLTDRLYADHQPGITHADIDRIVQQCRADLAGTPDAALPELLERLARQRLAGHRPAATPGSADCCPGGAPRRRGWRRSNVSYRGPRLRT